LRVKNELALIDLEKKKEEESNGLSSETPLRSQELELLCRSLNQKKKKGQIVPQRKFFWRSPIHDHVNEP
jgi:hypothetical protein